MAKAPAVKPSFGAGVLSGLRQAAGTTQGGEPLHIPLDQIAEDPDQPRSVFSDTELDQIAETIRLVGVLSPVGVRKRDGAGYILVYGARRLRASRLAGKTTIPAVLVPKDQATLAVQVIENQARTGLANSDLAAVVNRLFADKMPVKQIAIVCNIKEYQVAAFRSAEKLPPCLSSRLDNADMRALYDLSRAWEKQPAEVEAALPDEGTYLTITESRRILEGITGKAAGSVFSRPKDVQAGNAQEVGDTDLPVTMRPMLGPDPADSALHKKVQQTVPAPSRSPATRPSGRELTAAEQPASNAKQPVFRMELADGRRGVLVTARHAGARGMALVDVDGEEVVTAFAELRPVDVD